jgi:hypothetical protein
VWGGQTIKEANPPGLHTALEMIQRYRHQSKLVSEAGYIFAHVVSAVHFLETVSGRLPLHTHGVMYATPTEDVPTPGSPQQLFVPG